MSANGKTKTLQTSDNFFLHVYYISNCGYYGSQYVYRSVLRALLKKKQKKNQQYEAQRVRPEWSFFFFFSFLSFSLIKKLYNLKEWTEIYVNLIFLVVYIMLYYIIIILYNNIYNIILY